MDPVDPARSAAGGDHVDLRGEREVLGPVRDGLLEREEPLGRAGLEVDQRAGHQVDEHPHGLHRLHVEAGAVEHRGDLVGGEATAGAGRAGSTAPGTGGVVEDGQRLAGAEPIGFQLPKVDFAAMAESMGIPGIVVRTAEELDAIDFPALLSRGGPTLLDVRIDGEEVPPMNLRMKTLGTAR